MAALALSLVYLGCIIARFFSAWWAWNTFAHDLMGWPALNEWFQVFALLVLYGLFSPIPSLKEIRKEGKDA